jgi:hypothetical protein
VSECKLQVGWVEVPGWMESWCPRNVNVQVIGPTEWEKPLSGHGVFVFGRAQGKLESGGVRMARPSLKEVELKDWKADD